MDKTMTFQEIFIMNMKEIRKNRKISQLKLADLCESSQAYISEIEVGKKFPSPDMVERIASALEIESYYLFQNKTFSDNKVLTPEKRQEIIDKLCKTAHKIINQY